MVGRVEAQAVFSPLVFVNMLALAERRDAAGGLCQWGDVVWVM